jgi:hypothetical protein
MRDLIANFLNPSSLGKRMKLPQSEFLILCSFLIACLCACTKNGGGLIRIHSVSPTSGPYSGGTRITISGKNFARNTEVKVNYYYDCQSTTYVSSTQLECVMPANPNGSYVLPGSGYLTASIHVRDPSSYDSDTLNSGFTYQPHPVRAYQAPAVHPVRVIQVPVQQTGLADQLINFFDALNDGLQWPQRGGNPQAGRSLEQRISARDAHPAAQAPVWGQVETAMNDDSSVAAVESINRLDRRYPQVLNQAAEQIRRALDQVYTMVRDSAASTDKQRHQRAAALRFMDRVNLDFAHEFNSDGLAYNYRLAPGYRDPRSHLTTQELIALVWSAATDRSIFTTAADLDARMRSLVDAFATIQRAHNDHGESGAIIWNEAIEADQPSCYPGTYKRILESLNAQHPDVHGIVPGEAAAFAASVVGSGGGSVQSSNQSPSAAEISRDVQQTNAELFPVYFAGLTPARQDALRGVIDAYDQDRVATLPEYQIYLGQLRARVRQISPAITDARLEENTNVEAMIAYIGSELPEAE